MTNKIKILVNTSTFKTNELEPVADMINKLIDNLNYENQNLKFKILKPMSGVDNKVIKGEDYDIHSFRYFSPAKYQDLSRKGIKPSVESNKLNIFKVIFLFISQFFALLKLTISYKPDLIYCHWFLPQAINTYLVSKIVGTKYIFTSHGSDVLLINNLGKFGSYIVRVVTNSAHKYSAVSSLVLNEINKNLKTDKNNYKVIPMGIDERFFKLEKHQKYVHEKKKFLYIGRLIDYKGIDILLEALNLYKKNHKDFELNILGVGTESEKLKKLSEELALKDNVNFLGFKSYDQKIKYIKDCDLFFVPSKIKKGQIEGGPLTLIEGMSLGKVCIVSDSIGFVEHCSEKNSIIFESGNTESLYNAILRGVNLTEEETKSLSSGAINLSKTFSFSEIAKNHNNFFFVNKVGKRNE